MAEAPLFLLSLSLLRILTFAWQLGPRHKTKAYATSLSKAGTQNNVISGESTKTSLTHFIYFFFNTVHSSAVLDTEKMIKSGDS